MPLSLQWTIIKDSLMNFKNKVTVVLIGPRALKSLNDIKKIQPRMMVAMFNVNPSTTIISYYSPTKVSEETDLIAFYNKLSSLVHSISKHNVLIIGGDINA